MPTDENGCQETGTAVVAVVTAMTMSNSYVSTASSSSCGTSNAGDCCESASQIQTATSIITATSGSSLMRSCGAGDSRTASYEGGSESAIEPPPPPPAPREVHRVKFAEDLNEYLTSEDGLDFGLERQLINECRGGTGGWEFDSDDGDDVDGFRLHQRSQQQQLQQRVGQRPSIIKQARPRSPENHENPFTADGELCRKADYILRYSTISRRRIRIADPDCVPPEAAAGQQQMLYPVAVADSESDLPDDREGLPSGVAGCVDVQTGSSALMMASNGYASMSGSGSSSSPETVTVVQPPDIRLNGSSPTASTSPKDIVVEVDGQLTEALLDDGQLTTARHQQPTPHAAGRLRYNCCALQ